MSIIWPLISGSIVIVWVSIGVDWLSGFWIDIIIVALHDGIWIDVAVDWVAGSRIGVDFSKPTVDVVERLPNILGS